MPDERMFRKIIVGCDGKASGQDALALGHALNRLAHADLMAVGVYPDLMLPLPTHSELLQDVEQLLRADRDAIAPEARIRAIASASPASALRHAVDYERAELLVLGSESGTENGRVRAGRHARQLLHDAPCAVALAPVGYASQPTELRRILVGFDGSTEAEDALARARLLATATGARLRVLTAVDPMPLADPPGFEAIAYRPEDWEKIAGIRRRQARALLDQAITGAAGVETDVIDREPGVALCEASLSADMLVIGSRHWGPLARFVLGGTAEYVVRHAHCPVLVVPRRGTRAVQRAPAETMAAAA